MQKHKIYSDTIDGKTLDQFYSAMKNDFVVQGALMPDAHFGYTMPIGGVIATRGVIVPSWVGYDIGCGVCALRINNVSREEIKEEEDYIFDSIYEKIPVGPKQHSSQIAPMFQDSLLSSVGKEAFYRRGGWQALGTLGGGNHFIEIGSDEDGHVWIVVHSGSRGPGHGIATEYMKLASGSDKPKEGHYALDVNSDIGKNYIKDLNTMLEFALLNRKEMAYQVAKIVLESSKKGNASFEMMDIINRNHNHAEERDGLWIHRKGATQAEKEMLGVIPGNMRDGSIIVRGLGNKDSLYSSSHGAGRVLGRREAKRKLSVDTFRELMVGIKAKVGDSTLDESPLAYKDIFEVMENQKDLVEVVHSISPIINIKA